MPCQMTYKGILEVIDTNDLNERLAAFFTRWEAQQRCGDEPSRLQTAGGRLEHAQVAINGKALRPTGKEPPPAHHLRAYHLKPPHLLFHLTTHHTQHVH